ncbi:MAG TPA: hypothetical protein PKW08_00325 [Flavobacteriaceae bacterium]|nr:hypothetical protein [Flavobacteriaceae bacterium]MCB9211996.1 hypothetical protein [Alteromonas sp.]HPF09910.1 hypothetical protein [Flavobacteriaceae bacterium]HQU20007.1 hypothetical protein [Flavobacteriaceae bacterium]HQU64007.1 hypothetical protein [Flavobacteriaceae bacterium]
MDYLIKGRLYATICDESKRPLIDTKVRVYKLEVNDTALAALASAQSKELSNVYEEKDIKVRKNNLLAETTTDMNGEYSFQIDGEKKKYDGGPVAIVAFYDEVPDYGQGSTKPPKGFTHFEVLLDVIQPKWRERENGLTAGWNYTLLTRVWCYILKRLDLWVICGTVINCESQQPINGIEVIAMDDDIITDDLLGSALTDENGRFCIYYRSIDFKKTFLSPFINVETTPIFSFDNGPDIYFKFAAGGSIFFEESPSEAQKPSRKNVGNCLCVRLCLKEAPEVTQDPPAAFYQIGYARKYHPVLNIDPATGRTTGKAQASWNEQAFYSTLDLRGSLSKKFNGQPVEYKFEYAEVSSPSVDVSTIPTSSWNDVQESDMAENEIGTRITALFPVIKYNSYVIRGTNAVTPFGNEVKVEFDGNWVKVPQDSGIFDIAFNGSLIKLVSSKLASGNVNKSGLVQGNSSAPLEHNRYFALRMWKREQGNDATKVMAGFSRPLAIFNTLYDNVPQGGSWLPSSSSELGIASVDLQELIGGGCNKITNAIRVKYTAANPNLGNVSISFSGQGATNNFQPIVFPTPGEEAFGTSSYLGDFNLLKPCAYEIRLNVELNLTNGEVQHQGIWDRVLFCR